MNEFRRSCETYLDWMAFTHHSETTIAVRRRYLRYFFEWCEDRSLEDPQLINRAVIERYQKYMFNYRKTNGNALTIASQRGRIVALRGYFKYLAKNNYIPFNPASEIVAPRVGLQLPKDILNAEEVELVLCQPNLNTPHGLRDRAIMELFYSTGIRRAELAKLTIYDLDFNRKILVVREGKGRKDRIAPVGDRALDWIYKYLEKSRPKMTLTVNEQALFIAVTGQPISKDYLSEMVRSYIAKSGLKKKGSCHLFRHTVATLMLENGADIRYIQQLLGHAKIETTTIYTHVSIKQLQAVHKLTHPTSQKSKKKK